MFISGTAKVVVKLRRIEPGDLDRVVEIERASFPLDAYSRSHLTRLYRKAADGFIVAELNGEIVGYVIGCTRRELGRVDSLAVDLKCRSMGIGSALIEFILDRFATRGITKVQLEVRPSNQSAIRLYQRFGFQIVGTINRHYRDGSSAYRMVRQGDNKTFQTEVKQYAY